MLKWTLLALMVCSGGRLASAAEASDPNAAAAAAAANPNAARDPSAKSAAQDANGTLASRAVPASQDANNAAVSQDANAGTAPQDANSVSVPHDANAGTAPQDANVASTVSGDANEAVPALPQKKTLLISSNPVGAMVSIDEVEMGPTPLTVDRASLGDANSVTVRWSRYNCDPHTMQVQLDPNTAEIDVGAYLVRRKLHALGAQYTGYFSGSIAHGAAVFYRYYFPYHLFATAGLGVTTTIGSTSKAIPLVLLGVGYDSGASHDDPALPGLDRSPVAFTPSLEGELFGPPGLGALYLYPVSVRAYYAFASFGIGYQFNHTSAYSGFGCRLNVGAQWTFF